jgi:hypothetical protein
LVTYCPQTVRQGLHFAIVEATANLVKIDAHDEASLLRYNAGFYCPQAHIIFVYVLLSLRLIASTAIIRSCS